MANSTLTGLFTDIADAIREKNGTSGSIPALEFPDRIRSISGGGSDCMPVPDEYQGFVDEAKTLYDGDYSYLAVLESPNILNVAFLMDDFTVLSYDEASTAGCIASTPRTARHGGSWTTERPPLPARTM